MFCSNIFPKQPSVFLTKDCESLKNGNMKRKNINFLNQWHQSEDCKPFVIRGARQVGKTWLVRHFAESLGCKLIEINFEKQPKLASLFSSYEHYAEYSLATTIFLQLHSRAY